MVSWGGMKRDYMTAILFVCLGNICRSPLAEGLFRHRVAEAGLESRFEIASAGTGHWHIGHPPDKRSVAVAARYGVDISAQRAQQIGRADLERYDLILGLDRSNIANIQRLKTGPKHRARIGLYLEEALGRVMDVPDPYTGGAREFEAVYRMCDEASVALLKKLTGPDFPAT